MTKQPGAIPLRPDYARAASNAPNHVGRAAYIAAKIKAVNRSPEELFKQFFPGDEISPMLLETRATVAPGSTATSGWASQLFQNSVGAFIGSLGPTSAAAALIGRSPSLNIETDGLAVNIPVRAGGPYTPHWVNELSPIPAQTDALSTVPLGPARKLGSIVVMTRELLKRSDAAVAFNLMLREDASKGLDAAVFSGEDGLGDAHAGLLDGVSAISASSNPLRDMQNLAAAVSAGGGSGQVVFIKRSSLRGGREHRWRDQGNGPCVAGGCRDPVDRS